MRPSLTVRGNRPSHETPPLVRGSVVLHLATAIGLPLMPQWWPGFLALLLADHLALAVSSLLPRSTLIGPNLRRLPTAGALRQVALTFDDGPDPSVTPLVLAILAQRKVHATFFCVGHRAAAYPDLVREVARQGHRVENHSFRHSPGFCFLPPAAAGRDIDRAQRLLASLAGSEPRYFRAPAGFRNPWLHGVLAARDLRLVSWTRRGFDTVTRDPDAVLARLTVDLAPGDILVLHDGCGARRQEQAVIIKVLPRLLDELERHGLAAVALPPRECSL